MATPLSTATPPTLREIAQRAGVSHTTVSLSLRNDPTIPARTRERVRELADAMGYRSNVLVSALMTQVRLRQRQSTPEVVGFLTGGPTEADWRNHSSSVGFYEGARQRAQQLGMRLETFWLGPTGLRADETCRVLRARAIRGNLIAPFPLPVYAKPLDWSYLICVALGYAFRSQPLPRATHHHFRGSFTAVENLLRLGYRRIGLMLAPDENSRVGYSWLGGYLAAQQVFGGALLQPLFAPDFGNTREIRRWLAREKPDAIIGFGPKQMSALEAVGSSIPGDIGYAALDVQQTKLNAVNDVAGIDQNLPVIGATAMDLLAVQLYHNEHGLPQGPVLSMVEGRWVDGKTAPRREMRPPHQRAGRPRRSG
jgi:LacI family transcriptional regulator